MSELSNTCDKGDIYKHVPAWGFPALILRGGRGPCVPCYRLVLLACACLFILRKKICSFRAVCSNTNLSGLPLKDQHYWSTTQYHQEKAGASPCSRSHISSPPRAWDRQDFFSLHCIPMCSFKQVCDLYQGRVFLFFFFVLVLANPNYESKVVISDVNYAVAEQLLPLLLA